MVIKTAIIVELTGLSVDGNPWNVASQRFSATETTVANQKLFYCGNVGFSYFSSVKNGNE